MGGGARGGSEIRRSSGNMSGEYAVVTPAGTTVFAGRKTMCKLYIRQELAKGSGQDYLRIVKNKEAKRK
jgi:hypothetical protein